VILALRALGWAKPVPSVALQNIGEAA